MGGSSRFDADVGCTIQYSRQTQQGFKAPVSRLATSKSLILNVVLIDGDNIEVSKTDTGERLSF